MAGRPRLVKEGEPLWGEKNIGHDEAMEEDADTHQRRDTTTPEPNIGAHPSVAPQSSSTLARVAGPLPVKTRPSPMRTHLIIGGGPHVDDEASDTAQQGHHHELEDGDAMACSPPRSSSHMHHHQSSAHHQHRPQHHGSKVSHVVKTRLVIGGEQQQAPLDHTQAGWDSHARNHEEFPVERMEGVEHLGTKGPLVVMDGANIAWAYADAISGFAAGHHGNAKAAPDARGIQVAARYFLSVDVRVLVVIPASWFRAKPRAGDHDQSNAMMLTPQLEVLKDLKARGLLMAAPPTDDDDAYALTVARREDARARQRRDGGGGGFVLSCDMFRDAMFRDATGELKTWLQNGRGGNGPGRISFAFCDMGSTDDYGDPQMDFVPNPRHPLISWIESQYRQQPYHS